MSQNQADVCAHCKIDCSTEFHTKFLTGIHTVPANVYPLMLMGSKNMGPVKPAQKAIHLRAGRLLATKKTTLSENKLTHSRPLCSAIQSLDEMIL